MSVKTILVAIVDLIFIHAAILSAFYVRYLGEVPWRNFEAYISISPWISLIALGLLWLYGLMPFSKVRAKEDIFPATFLTTILLNFGIMAVSFFSREFAFPRSVIIIEAFFLFGFLMLWRHALSSITYRVKNPLKLCVISGEEEQEYITDRLHGEYKIALKITDHNNIEDIMAVIDEFMVLHSGILDGVIIGRDIDPKIRSSLSEALVSRRLRVYVLPSVYEVLIAGGNVSTFKDIPVIELKGDQINQRFNLARRVMDIFIASMLLLILCPIMLLCAIAICIESGRPVIYKQERITLQGNSFILYKFRSMVHNAEDKTGPVLATENDHRITTVGKIMRSLRLDELPQLVNVLQGYMSMVGPRPERPIFVDEITARIPGYKLRHEIKCGITGMAQVQGKYSTRVEDKLVWDLLYTKKHNPLLDINLILQTLKTVLIRDKAS
ncbi:sugar transferase [Desulfotomaculum defluvii]